MDVEYLRKALKLTWLNYYRANRQWLVRLGIWINYEEARRPSASFILGTLSVAEPQLIQLLPLVVDLNANPDRIVTALGLNFNPEDELEALEKAVQAEPVMQPLPRMLLSPKPPLQPETPVVEIAAPINQIAAPINQSVEPQVERSVKQASKPPSRAARASQPAKSPAASQSTKPPAQQLVRPDKLPAKLPAKPPQPTRRTLDTAQLSPQELPDRI